MLYLHVSIVIASDKPPKSLHTRQYSNDGSEQTLEYDLSLMSKVSDSLMFRLKLNSIILSPSKYN